MLPVIFKLNHCIPIHIIKKTLSTQKVNKLGSCVHKITSSHSKSFKNRNVDVVLNFFFMFNEAIILSFYCKCIMLLVFAALIISKTGAAQWGPKLFFLYGHVTVNVFLCPGFAHCISLVAAQIKSKKIHCTATSTLSHYIVMLHSCTDPKVTVAITAPTCFHQLLHLSVGVQVHLQQDLCLRRPFWGCIHPTFSSNSR